MTEPSPSTPPARVQRPQAALAPHTAAAVFLVATIDEGGEAAVREVLADLAGLARTVGSRVPSGGLTLVTGIGSDAWDRLFAGPRPAGLHPFEELRGAVHRAPSTPGDLLFHLRAEQADLCFELATLIVDALRGAVTVVDEVYGLKYFDNRTLIGFVDGTENPVDELAQAAVVVGDEDPDFAGSSYVVVQKYLHDLAAWNALSVEDQERAIGRRKLSNLELADDVKPSNSHIALNVIAGPDGQELKILRQNMAFGAAGHGEFGTYFIGYARTPEVTERLLRNMFLGDPPGNHDRLLDFSTAVTGGLFFVPTDDFLDDPPAAPGAASSSSASDRTPSPSPTPPSPTPPSPGDGSLGIGSLVDS